MPIDPHLIPLRPHPPSGGPCPRCAASSVEARGVVFAGIPVMGHYSCKGCGYLFYRDLPQGFAMDHPITIGEDGTVHEGEKVPDWIMEPFLKGFRAPNEAPIAIERRVFQESRRIVVLNTLDFLYGHVLLKLYNAQHYLDHEPDLGLVVILPRMYAWLIPEGVAEAWIVDLRLGGMHGWHTAIDRFVQERLPHYDEVHLAKGYSHPDVSGLDIARFTGVRPFDPERFDREPPHVTFVVRQDRLWYRWPLAKFLHRVFRKLGLEGSLGRLMIGDQRRMVGTVMARLRKSLPGVTFSVVGLGPSSSWASDVNDLRTERMDVEVERSWCRAYAKSQVVVGVHGSNMLLPTALAAGCVEILPHDRLGNIVQDISVRYADRMQLFLYRFVDEFASPSVVARHVVAIFAYQSTFRRNNLENVF